MTPITIQLKRVDPELPLPAYHSPQAAALDLASRTTVTIEPGQVVKVPLNVVIKLPADHWVLMAARSSLQKKGVQLANGIGVGDADFCGEHDEYQAALLNFSRQPVTIERGERIVQIVVLPRPPVVVEEVAHMSAPNRGGFGSTGR
jgi:dUTP pyrophosphatase